MWVWGVGETHGIVCDFDEETAGLVLSGGNV